MGKVCYICDAQAEGGHGRLAGVSSAWLMRAGEDYDKQTVHQFSVGVS